MNYSEFKELIWADPWNRDPETVAAREEDPRCDAAAREAQAFDRRLQDALRVQAPDDLDEVLLNIPEHPRPERLTWFAAAASVLVMVGVGAVYWHQPDQPMSMEEYLELHYDLDGVEVLASASPDFDRAEVNRLMATLDAMVDPELVGKVRFIKYCPTLHGRGAHMVVSSGRGMLTVFYMPNTAVDEERLIHFNGRQAQLLALDRGSAAIFGATDQPMDHVKALVQRTIHPLPSDA